MNDNDKSICMSVEILLVEDNPSDVDSYALGVNSYIVKPVDFNQFNQAVKDLGHYWLLLNQPPLRANR
jgi:DNA-binding NarL/FixJ family response regulator